MTADATVDQLLADAAAAHPTGYVAEVESFPPVVAILAGDVASRAILLRPVLEHLVATREELDHIGSTAPGSPERARFIKLHNKATLLGETAKRLVRANLRLGDIELADIIGRVAPRANNQGDLIYFPIAGLLRQVELATQDGALSPAFDRPLAVLAESLRDPRNSRDAPTRKLVDRVAKLLSGREGKPALADSAWSRDIVAWVNSLDGTAATAWRALLAHAATATQARPNERWLEPARAALQAVGAATAAPQMARWLDAFTPDPANPDPNTDAVKGLVWIAALIGDPRLPSALGGLAERSLRKVPEFGARSVKLGNACVQALTDWPEAAGAAELSRLKGKLRYPGAAKQLERALGEAAARLGRTVEELEELVVPDFGLDRNGQVAETIDGCVARLAISGTDTVELIWEDGKRNPPARLKGSDAVKDLQRRVKEIAAALGGQALRLEQLLLEQRRWPVEAWRQLYLDHPLLAQLTRRLIWRFDDVIGIPHGDKLVDAFGTQQALPTTATVQLWHPAQCPAALVQAWRQRLDALDLVQPFKQAHREVYILTDAERRTATYSNRFAAHILRQHQFRALCLQRGWDYQLQGYWDSHNVPRRRLPRLDLAVEFSVEPARDEMPAGGSGMFRHVATDQVRFVDAHGHPRRLTDIDPIAFSELMRDVDLFVSVCSIGNDPTWLDDGRAPHADYWQAYAFGELNATAQTRRAVLEVLLPKLKIADRCALTERFLEVRGTRRSYKIHLGSGNIRMAPNDQYLCVVEDRGKRGVDNQELHLPFEGDAMLSMILSKAFLLAEDQRITDPSILSQIEG